MGSLLALPLPGGVPFTLQLAPVLLAGAMLGPRVGPLSEMVCLMLGMAGAPVFAGFTSGLPHLRGPTGGFLLSFPPAAGLTGRVRGPARRLAGRILDCLADAGLSLASRGLAALRLRSREGRLAGSTPLPGPYFLKAALAGVIAHRALTAGNPRGEV